MKERKAIVDNDTRKLSSSKSCFLNATFDVRCADPCAAGLLTMQMSCYQEHTKISVTLTALDATSNVMWSRLSSCLMLQMYMPPDALQFVALSNPIAEITISPGFSAAKLELLSAFSTGNINVFNATVQQLIIGNSGYVQLCLSVLCCSSFQQYFD